MDHFTTQLIQKFVYNSELNIDAIISPMSIYVALVLVIFGSAGDTHKELIKALQFPTAEYD